MKFLEDPYQTLGAGFALTVVLILLYLGMAGLGAGDADWFGIVFRWIHFLAGITWIGLLYFFNLINAAFMKTLDGPTKNIVIPKLMPPALNWFRHGATVTVLAGLVLYFYLYSKGGTGAIALGIGGLLGIIMMVNVHAIIWPNQKKIIAAVSQAAAGGPPPPAEMAQWGKTALLASRVNFLLSIPMLWFMGAGSHFK
ncbi:MAG: urate hydroxylase PuuD [Nitrospiraceae bacterium]